jgi:hypothetical protein
MSAAQSVSSNAVTVPEPRCLDDFALQPNSKFKLESILDLTLPFPGNGVCGIILYGLYGTGKTTLGNLLPGLIDFAKSDPAASIQQPGQMISSDDTYFDHHPCAQGQNQIVQNGIGASDKLDALITQLKIEIDDLAKPNLEHTKAKIDLWCEQHNWTHIDSHDTAQNDLQTQLAA